MVNKSMKQMNKTNKLFNLSPNGRSVEKVASENVCSVQRKLILLSQCSVPLLLCTKVSP